MHADARGAQAGVGGARRRRCSSSTRSTGLIAELQLSPLDAWQHLKNIIDEVNALAGHLFAGAVLFEDASRAAEAAGARAAAARPSAPSGGAASGRAASG